LEVNANISEEEFFSAFRTKVNLNMEIIGWGNNTLHEKHDNIVSEEDQVVDKDEAIDSKDTFWNHNRLTPNP
jgi:hypothetical protein